MRYRSIVPPTVALLTALATGCGPSEAEQAARAGGRAGVAEVRGQADAQDIAFRRAVESFDDARASACTPSGLRSVTTPTGQSPQNYAEYRRDELERLQLPITRAVRADLARATELLNDETETFRWANGAQLAADAAETLASAGGYDLVLITSSSRPEAGAETFRSERMQGHLFGWDAGREAIVCAGVFDADPPGSVDVRTADGTTDLLRSITYRMREVAFEAAGLGEVEPSRYGEPSIW